MSEKDKKTKSEIDKERDKKIQERLKELKKRDPFIYKNF
jgi:hypothetical protein